MWVVHGGGRLTLVMIKVQITRITIFENHVDLVMLVFIGYLSLSTLSSPRSERSSGAPLNQVLSPERSSGASQETELASEQSAAGRYAVFQ